MKTKSRNIIYTLCAGMLLGIISIVTNQVSINDATREQAFMLYSATALGVPFIIALVKALPEPVKLKYIFNIKYFYYVSLIVIGVGIILAPFLTMNGKSISGSLFFCYSVLAY